MRIKIGNTAIKYKQRHLYVTNCINKHSVGIHIKRVFAKPLYTMRFIRRIWA